MKKLLLVFSILSTTWCFGQQQTVSYSVYPSPFEEGDNITLTFDGTSIDEAAWGVGGNALYLWPWSYDLGLANQQDCPTNGTWTSSSETNRLTYNGGTDTYTISFVPTAFYSRTGIGRIGFLTKAKDGTGDKKSQDMLEDVGAFQIILNSPSDNSTTIINSGDDLVIDATNTGGNADYVLKANGAAINSQSNTSAYSYTDMNITDNKSYVLEVTLGPDTKTKAFSVLVDLGVIAESMPMAYEDGINYDSGDPTKATLVLDAPNKSFIYVAGSFNNWQPDASYAMKKDFSVGGKFWLEITGLTSQQIESYQYWVADKTPIANSPALVKTADPYSTLVLSPFDDPGISPSTYPSLPTYPAGQEREVTVLQTGQTAYPWVVTNFTKPKKEDLIIYELLIRDFDTDRNFQDLIDKIDYFKDLNINAIELMPVMEFEGNESWGYNTAFHMALDKFYGTEDKFREFIDLCHQNGIAVILDVAFNHAFGRNPMVRMWMDDPDNDGWGGPSSENPYFNQTATHSYSVGSDFNQSLSRTQSFVKRVIKHWIEDFKIDGFRWDLTKGFTQNCTGNEGCTNSYQADRVAILKDYADYSWGLDPDHYVIFEHLGDNGEETEWANYRLGEGKGIMLWGKTTDQYNQLTMGYNSSNDISGMGHLSRGFTGKRLVGYAESHDEERLMYKNLQFGNSNGGYDVTDLNTALSRMSPLGAVTIPIPGPKMIWHFAELGMENSIFICNDGSVNDPDCKLDTKPQPQWANNWLGDINRNPIYSDWARLIDLKINEAVFEGDYSITANTLTPKIYIFDNAIDPSNLKNVVILANFDLTTQNITPNFPYTGDWYDLMDETGNTSINVTNVTTPINILAGEFRIYGNQSVTLGADDFELKTTLKLYPNPTSTAFQLNRAVETVSIFDLTGKLITRFKGDFQARHEFDVSKISQGMYIAKFDDHSSSVSKRLIIN